MSESDNESTLSDEELQEAFAAGLLKPGLNIPTEPKKFKNNVVRKANLTWDFRFV